MIGDSQILISDIFFKAFLFMKSRSVPYRLVQSWECPVIGSCEVKTVASDDLSWHAKVSRQKLFFGSCPFMHKIRLVSLLLIRLLVARF